MTPFADMAAILLAAGFSRRMGGENKLLKPLGGVPLIIHVLTTLSDIGLGRLVVVLGESGETITPLLPPAATVIRNERAGEGMGASLASGARALDPALAGAFVVLADMPFVARSDYERLAAAFGERQGQAICIPMHEGRRGHPVLFPARYFPELAACSGDSGARHVLSREGVLIREVADCSPGVLADFDDQVSFSAYTAKLGAQDPE